MIVLAFKFKRFNIPPTLITVEGVDKYEDIISRLGRVVFVVFFFRYGRTYCYYLPGITVVCCLFTNLITVHKQKKSHTQNFHTCKGNMPCRRCTMFTLHRCAVVQVSRHVFTGYEIFGPCRMKTQTAYKT